MFTCIAEDILDALVANGTDPLEAVEYLFTQHLLEDGVKGECEYQDKLAEAWIAAREAHALRKVKKCKEFVEHMSTWG